MAMTPQKSSDRWLEFVGIPTRILIYASLFGLLYLFKPEDIFNTPLGGLTLSAIFGTAIWLGMVGGLLCLLFNPSDDPKVRQMWGNVGILLVAGTVIWSIHLSRK